MIFYSRLALAKKHGFKLTAELNALIRDVEQAVHETTIVVKVPPIVEQIEITFDENGVGSTKFLGVQP